ncbi:TolC family outer membrane protein [uncultured Paraglaciecola sp.]|uniref:TolC family outer membrane protein n=1 Tax=uncultured Paraglaciecola sp. TaxID=1765024 RepID=UPI0026274BA1|nr:TolC family outer membrane protein [uncultured Paraglaciecola sp.]
MNKSLFTKGIRAAIYTLCLASTSGTHLYAQSLEQTVALALDTHPDIRQAFARFKSKEEDVNRASAGYLPTVDITAGYGYEYTDTPGNRRADLGFSEGETELRRGEFGVSLRQMLFDGMFTSSEVKRTKYEASAEQWALISTAEDLALSVSKGYLNHLKNQQLVTLSEKNVASHQQIYKQIKERTDSGMGSIADLSQVTGRLARAQSNLISARNNLRDARAEFISLTNIAPSDLVMPVPDADMLPKDSASGLISAIERHPLIKSARQDINAARAYGGSVQANYYPKLSLELDANVDNDIAGEDGLNRNGISVGGYRNDLTVMLRMRYNLYSGGKDIALERSAAYKTTEAQEINYRAHREVTESFGLAWNAYEMLGLQKQYIQQHVVTSKETQQAYQQQFTLGQRNLLDLLDTENELFQARKDYLDANFDELGARYRLLNVTGQLLASLRVTRSQKWQGEHEYGQGDDHE